MISKKRPGLRQQAARGLRQEAERGQGVALRLIGLVQHQPGLVLPVAGVKHANIALQ